MNEYSFTVKSWEYIGELHSTVRDLPQAFIAMHFLSECS